VPSAAARRRPAMRLRPPPAPRSAQRRWRRARAPACERRTGGHGAH
jgi:hypothetical protein